MSASNSYTFGINLNDPEVQKMVVSIASLIYNTPNYVFLRKLETKDDFIQDVWFKLLYRDNYKRYSSQYKLSSFIYRVCKCVAIQNMTKKHIQVIDMDDNHDEDRDLHEVLTDVNAPQSDPSVLADSKNICKHIRNILATDEPNPRVHFIDDDSEVSLVTIFDRIMNGDSREEINECIINNDTGTPVTQTTFSRWYNDIEMVVKRELKF